MSLLPDTFIKELTDRTPLAPLISRRIKLEKAGKQWKACCPFHTERTPSFVVYDDHWHCFGCNERGDAIDFVQRTQSIEWRDAVKLLAQEAGLEVPETPREAEAQARRVGLHGILARCAEAYAERLWSNAGNAARAYLQQRGLSADDARNLGLGWSGNSVVRGVTPEEMDGVGLMRRGEDDKPVGPLFVNRVMAPIRDRQGRIVSFTGRTLGDATPKYVNGHETALFAKRRTLYGIDVARSMATKGAPVGLVEGNFDVIAAQASGIAGVAPLGTALTEEHLLEAWRLSPVPVLMLDGDEPGRRATLRSLKVALPQITGERSLKVALLPADADPDSLRRERGAEALQACAREALPLHVALFDLLREPADEDTPEGKARLRNRLEEAAAMVRDRPMRDELRSALLSRFFEARRSHRAPAQVTALPAGNPDRLAGERGRVLIACVLNSPEVLNTVEDVLGRLPLPRPWSQVRDAVLDYADPPDAWTRDRLTSHLAEVGLSGFRDAALADPLPDFAKPGAQTDRAEAGFSHMAALFSLDALEAEIAAAREAFAENPSTETQNRFVALLKERGARMRV